MSAEQFANLAVSTLAAALTDAVGTSLTVVSASPFPLVAQFRLLVDQELMLVTAVSGSVFTVTRGIEDTTAAPHASGAAVAAIVTAEALRQIGLGNVANPALLQTDWYVDWALGDDGNDGAIPSTPVKTIMGGIAPKWGTNAPVLAQSTTIHIVSSQPVNAEEIILRPEMRGGNFAIVNAKPKTRTVTLGAVTAKNRATGVRLQVAGITSAAIGQLLINTSRGNSRAIIESVTGGVATVQQPHASLTLGTDTVYWFSAPPAENDSWTVGDSVDVYDLPALNLVEARGTGSMVNAAVTVGATLWIEQIHLLDPTGVPGSVCLSAQFSGGYINVQDCWVESYGLTTTDTYFNGSLGTFWAAGGEFQQTAFLFGGIGGDGGQFLHITWLDGDVALTTVNATTGLLFCGLVNIDVGGEMILHPGTEMEIRQNILPATGVLWGSGTLGLQSNSTCVRRLPTSSWATCLYVTNLSLTSHETTGTAYASGTFTDGISITPANLDTYHGLQDVRTGARFCEDL